MALKNKKPTRCHLLYLLYFLDTQHVSGINMSIFRSLRLCCWTTTLTVLFLDCFVLELGCGSAFRRISLLLFYIFFWEQTNSYFVFNFGLGVSAQRVQAGIYLLFYTLLASLPLLVDILFVYNSLGSLYLFLLCEDSSLVGGLFYVFMVFAFLVRIPICIVHLWLPRAHVEAPVSGSTILAGVLLKLCFSRQPG